MKPSVAVSLSAAFCGILAIVQPANAGCGFLDITCRDSGIREVLRENDPTRRPAEDSGSDVGPVQIGTRQSVLNFCNQTSDVVFAAYTSFDDPNGWQSHGWYKVDAGNCRRVSIGRPYKGDVFVYAERNSGAKKWNGQDAVFCVNRTQGFHLPHSDKNCNGDGGTHKRVGMRKLTIRPGLNRWTLIE